jgi:putative PIG3 family NAD(P)H quinone oxidoreductase
MQTGMKRIEGIKILSILSIPVNFFYNDFMKAVYVKEFGGIENLEIREVENPAKPKGTEVIVEVAAAGLNRADLLQRKGLYPAPKGYPERILGLEFAGEVVDVGENVTKVEVGERVIGITAGGAQAEFLAIDESQLVKIPDSLSFAQAAAIPEAFITAHDAIFTQGNLKSGETLLIHAVGSGVGLAALQLAKAIGAKVFGTSRTYEKLGKCKEFGLDEAIVVDEEPDFADVIKSNGNGVDVILDLVGGRYFPQNLESLNLKGRLILVGLTSGAKSEFNLGIALAKRLKIIGTVLRSRSLAEKAEATARFAEEVIPLFEAGLIRPNLEGTYPIEDVQKAHQYLESNQSFGKIVLEF